MTRDGRIRLHRLIDCTGIARDTDAVGRRVIVPHRIDRPKSTRWEIADAIFESAEWDGRTMTYRESYWEVPPLGSWMDSRGRYHKYEPDPGVYYRPEAT